METKEKQAERIMDLIEDLVTDFMYYDRKEDPKLRPGLMEKLILEGYLVPEKMAEKFLKEIKDALTIYENVV